jgi:hypothetical protein
VVEGLGEKGGVAAGAIYRRLSPGVVTVISLFDGAPSLTEDDLRRLAPFFHEGGFPFVNCRTDLHVRDNVIYRLVVSGQLISVLKAPDTNTGARLERLYRRCFINGNVFRGVQNSLVTEHLSLSSDSFEGESGDQRLVQAGAVVAHAAIHVGNYAPHESIRLLNLARRRDVAANALITVVDF